VACREDDPFPRPASWRATRSSSSCSRARTASRSRQESATRPSHSRDSGSSPSSARFDITVTLGTSITAISMATAGSRTAPGEARRAAPRLDGAAPLTPLPEPVDLEQYRVRKHAHADGTINEYRLVA
jgi:hypothetical protein